MEEFAALVKRAHEYYYNQRIFRFKRRRSYSFELIIGYSALEKRHSADRFQAVIPASLKEIGIGAFGASSSLKEFKIEEGNKVFFVNDGVLYRNIKPCPRLYGKRRPLFLLH